MYPQKSWQEKQLRQSQNLQASPDRAQLAEYYQPSHLWIIINKKIGTLQHWHKNMEWKPNGRKSAGVLKWAVKIKIEIHRKAWVFAISPVYHVMRVKVGKALKCTVGNSSYFHLLQRLFMHCRGTDSNKIFHRGKTPQSRYLTITIFTPAFSYINDHGSTNTAQKIQLDNSNVR